MIIAGMLRNRSSNPLLNIANWHEVTLVADNLVGEDDGIRWCKDRFSFEGNTNGWTYENIKINSNTFIMTRCYYFRNEEDAVAFRLTFNAV